MSQRVLSAGSNLSPSLSLRLARCLLLSRLAPSGASATAAAAAANQQQQQQAAGGLSSESLVDASDHPRRCFSSLPCDENPNLVQLQKKKNALRLLKKQTHVSPNYLKRHSSQSFGYCTSSSTDSEDNESGKEATAEAGKSKRESESESEVDASSKNAKASTTEEEREEAGKGKGVEDGGEDESSSLEMEGGGSIHAQLLVPTRAASAETEAEEEEPFEDSEVDGEEKDEEEEKSMREKLEAAADMAQAVLTPQTVCDMLDRHIVGQADAKRSVAIALRNRWRRSRVEDKDLRKEIAPKNILMIGPTGCGKTEIARRLAALADAPFVKVEATKFTEVGFHGRDVDEMVRELVESAVVLTRKRWKRIKQKEVERNVERKILRSLLGGEEDDATKKAMLLLYRDQALEDREVTIEVPATRNNKENLGNFLKPGAIGSTVDNNTITDMIVRIEKVMGPHFGKDGRGPTEHKKMKVSKARPLLEEMEMDKLLTEDHITKEAIKIAEEEGIIFIDEIDKIVTTSDARTGTEASSEGVQQDLLPIVEGSMVNTKLGQVNTNHMLFIASGAFHSVKPSDMLAELQGRLPIRVELTGLTKEDLYRILTEPDNNMVVQQKALLATEGVNLEVTDAAIMEIAEVASEVNKYVDNIGARRLHTVLERVLDEVSFDASEQGRIAKEEGRECHIVIDKADVQEKVGHLVEQTDLSRFIL